MEFYIKVNDEWISTELVTGSSFAVESKLISFTINSSVYQAEKGMSWFEWLQSSYYESGAQIVSCETLTSEVLVDSIRLYDLESWEQVYGSDVITANGSYSSKHTGVS